MSNENLCLNKVYVGGILTRIGFIFIENQPSLGFLIGQYVSLFCFLCKQWVEKLF